MCIICWCTTVCNVCRRVLCPAGSPQPTVTPASQPTQTPTSTQTGTVTHLIHCWQNILCLLVEESAVSLHHLLLCSKVWMGCVDCFTCMSRHCVCCLLHIVGCLSAVEMQQACLLLHCVCALLVQHHAALSANDALCACCTCIICRTSECCDEPTASKSSLFTMLQMPPSLCPSYACTGSFSITCEIVCACMLLASCWNW